MIREMDLEKLFLPEITKTIWTIILENSKMICFVGKEHLFGTMEALMWASLRMA